MIGGKPPSKLLFFLNKYPVIYHDILNWGCAHFEKVSEELLQISFEHSTSLLFVGTTWFPVKISGQVFFLKKKWGAAALRIKLI